VAPLGTLPSMQIELLGSVGGDVTVVSDERVVDDGVVTSAGVSAGIDMSLYLVESICGRAVAEETAHYIEYRRAPL
jgi:transcriptional regulator GlxA family with amidase domain